MTTIPSLTAELLVDAHAMVGEGPVWDAANGRLLWVDIPAGAIHSFSARGGHETIARLGQPVGSVGLRRDGGLVVGLRDGFGFVERGATSVGRLVEVERDVIGNRMNEGKPDPKGRFWAGTMAADHTPEQGTLYRLQALANAGYDVAPMLRGLTIANGLDWSPDGRMLYYIDSATQRVDCFDFDPETGSLGERRPLIDIPPAEGLPDGMIVDEEGCLWVALFGAGRIRRYSPDGRAKMDISVPVTLVTSCAFGGSSLDELYITTARHRLSAEQAKAQPTAGGLFVCRPGTVGRPPSRFG